MTLLSPATKADLEAELQRRGINPYKPKRKPWAETARPEQLRPEGCEHFILLGGRGGGKTRAAAEDVLNIARQGGHVIHVLSPTYKEIKGVCMDGVGGSSLMELVDRSELMPGSTGWNQTDLIMRFRNGSVIRGFTAEEPGRLNGPQASHLWCDEFGLCSVEAIDMAMFGLRLGKRVTSTWSSTPKPRPGTKYVLGLFPDAHVSRMRTIDNAANLAKNFIDHVTKQYAGTRLGKAELDGELVEDVDGALWSASWFDRPGFRLDVAIGKDQTGQLVCIPPEGLVRIVVAIDPSVTDPAKRKDPHKDPDACGMIVAGVDALGRGYVLGDFTAIMAPAEWARLAIRLYDMCKASKIVAEANQGGELIREVLKSVAGNVPIQLVHASMGKRPRAEPVAMLFEQCLVGETLVKTATGDKPISAIKAGEMVWTRNGLRKVEWGGKTGTKPCYEITTTDGTSFKCTDNHRIFTQRGWVRCDQLNVIGDILYKWESNTEPLDRAQNAGQPLTGICAALARRLFGGNIGHLKDRSLNSTERDIIRTRKDTGGPVVTVETGCCIGTCTSTISAKSRKDSTCTILTRIQATTLRTTCLPCIHPTTLNSTQGKYTQKRLGLLSLQRTKSIGKKGNLFRLFAKFAGTSFTPRAPERMSACAPQNVGTPIGLKSIKPCGVHDVYDLQVNSDHEFYANGILVHNSRIFHCGTFMNLEAQMTSWDASDPTQPSPNNIDAMVWAFHALGLCNVTGTRERSGIVKSGIVRV